MNSPINKERSLDIINHQKAILRYGTWQSCLNCENFDKEKEQCSLFNARPPAEVIVHGCEAYEMEIPF